MSRTGNTGIQHMIEEVLQGRPSLPQQVDHSVAAVVTVEGDFRYFPLTLRSIVAQSVMPGIIVIADCSGETAQPSHMTLSITLPASAVTVGSSLTGVHTDVGYHAHGRDTVDIQVVRAKGAVSFGDAVSRGLQYAGLGQQTRALWLLHDDSRPCDVNCLETLLEAWHNAPTAALLGAKQLDWDGQLLHEVGAYAGRHEIARLVVDGEPDQEQYDTRQDVFEVDLAGALLPIATYRTMNGFMPWFGSFAESWDFSRRICLHAGRVVVVPKARIAHRRARYEGVRSHSGEPLGDDRRESAYLPRIRARWRYRFTDITMILWPLVWLMSIPAALVAAVERLFAKQPWDAWCELCAPWLGLTDLPAAVAARRKVVRQSVIPLGKLSLVAADGHQLRQWRQRCRALESQNSTVLLSPLAIAHLRTRAIRRWVAAAGMMTLSAGIVVAVYWNVLRGALAGGSLYSGQLLASAATYPQLAEAATTPWAFGVDTGYPAPPTPFLLVWLVVATLMFGHVNAALTLMFFAAAPISALSFWALAGIFTRSNAVRVTCGLLWTALGMALGLYHAGNIAMLVVMMFLPAAFGFAFRAIGLYHTEDPARPHPSIQASACAALSFMPVVASQPQLLFPLLAIFIAFVIFVPRRRVMLLLIPLPAAVAAAPALVNAVRYAQQGAFRQLFADVTLPDRTLNGTPSALEITGLVRRAFGIDLRANMSMWLTGNVWETIMVITLLVVAVLSVAALFVPFALRVSRLMWIAAIAGMLTAMVSARVVVSVDDRGAVAGSVLPGVVFIMLGLISCVCQVSGGAVRRFNPLRTGELHLRQASGPSAMRVWRSALVVLLVAAACAWFGFGTQHTRGSSIQASSRSLPMVAIDYLDRNPSHRVLALYAETDNIVRYSVMRTGRGDIVDSSPAMRVRMASGSLGSTHDALNSVSARLLANGDADAISTLVGLGFGGIYVVTSYPAGVDPGSETDEAESGDLSDDVGQRLISNISSTEDVQQVVNNSSGTYYRLVGSSSTASGIDTAAQHRAQVSIWRQAWLWSMGVVVALYCLVALPRSHRYEGRP